MILVVDDDHAMVQTLSNVLTKEGYEVRSAHNGEEAYRHLLDQKCKGMILDMMMPKRSGFLVLEKLRRTRPVPLRVIMITANEGSRHKAYAEMLGVDDYIRKPFAMDRLLGSVSRLLGE